MNPIYHVAAPPPALAGTDALWQDIDLLAGRFGGDRFSVYPFSKPMPLVPPLLYGWSALRSLRALDQPGRLHHIVSPVAHAFPYLRRLKQPLVYSVVAAVNRRPPNWLLARAMWIANNPRDRRALEKAGAARVVEIPPGLDLERFARVPPPPSGPFTLLMASAPWTRAQFASKGVDLLLEALNGLPEVHLILLWRGHHAAALQSRIDALSLRNRVELINRAVEVPQILARAHAVILLARRAKLVKAWPHSLVEGLAAGRHVLTSEAVAMSDFLREQQAGFVLADWTVDALRELIASARAAATPPRAVRQLALEVFSVERMLDALSAAYGAAAR